MNPIPIIKWNNFNNWNLFINNDNKLKINTDIKVIVCRRLTIIKSKKLYPTIKNLEI